jgi:DNA polymerase-4
MSINLPPKDFSVLFLDMNSFFASVEQQVRPELRGVPIGIAPYTGDTGCIISASKEAKKMGISVSRVAKAKEAIPDIKILEARPALYMIYHKEIKRVIEKFTPFYTVLSIDEFSLKLTPREQNKETALNLAQDIKKAIKGEVGDYLTCSIGIGPSRFLAKMAAERKKPDGLTMVALNDLEKFYLELSLLDITGINFRMEKRLKYFNLNTPLDFFNSSLGYLSRVLNHPGKSWYFRLRGYEVDDFHSETKTIGHSHVLEPGLRNREAAISVLRKMVFKAGYRIRKEGYRASGVYLSIRFLDKSSFGLSRKADPFSDDWTFWNHISSIIKECSWRTRPIYLAVGVFGLAKKEGEQISIFKEIEKKQRLAEALDQINDNYGADTVISASMMRAGNSAPDRIPMGRPRYDILH